MNLSHSFSVEIASKYDVHQALLLQHFSFWYLKNKADDVNFFSSDYWVRMKLEKLVEYFPYLTERQLSYTLKKLVEGGLLKSEKFNEKRYDRTNWYTFTKKGKKMLKIGEKSLIDRNVSATDKIVSHSQENECKSSENKGFNDEKSVPTDKIVSGSQKPPTKLSVRTDKIVSCIYKEVDIEYRYILLLELLSANKSLIELIAMRNRVKIATVEKMIPEFCKQVLATEEFYNNNSELFKHFQNWFKKQKVSDVDCEQELSWFIRQFNKISRKEYSVTDQIRELFTVQLSNGFTGKQMVKAVRNLYSSSPKNDFHQKNSFKFATPEYLLKDGNLNKYANVKY